MTGSRLAGITAYSVYKSTYTDYCGYWLDLSNAALFLVAEATPTGAALQATMHVLILQKANIED